MMNLVIDIGNTAIKTAVFQNNSLIERKDFFKEDFFKKIKEIIDVYPHLTHVVLSSVVKNASEELKLLRKNLKVLVLDHNIQLPFINKYATPETLGKDRIVLMAAARFHYPGKNVLVIDAGTCITFDFKNEKDEYLGGAISPGLEMRFKALHKFTANLPLVKKEERTELIGNSTESCIRSGVINGSLLEIEGAINSYKAEDKYLTVILTGGDTQFLSKRLKNGIFANPNFLLEGLNYILEFNKTQ